MRPTHAIPRPPAAALLLAVAFACAPSSVRGADAGAGAPAAHRVTVEWIRAALANFPGLPVAPAREITPHVMHPDDATRAVELRGAFPNPFRSETAIRFALPQPARVQVRLYDVSGRLVRTLVDAQMPAGDHSAMVRADGLQPGVYWARLQAGAVAATRRVVLMR
jgi:hypothetical protein